MQELSFQPLCEDIHVDAFFSHAPGSINPSFCTLYKAETDAGTILAFLTKEIPWYFRTGFNWLDNKFLMLPEFPNMLISRFPVSNDLANQISDFIKSTHPEK